MAALIAGISMTFLVEVKFDFTADSTMQTRVYQVATMASMLVCCITLYATMVLSSQYYLVTRAMGNISSTCIEVRKCGIALLSGTAVVPVRVSANNATRRHSYSRSYTAAVRANAFSALVT